jgi:ribonuclease BN (tRNA processing enzyme)
MAPFSLTILGAGTAAPNPGGANSGYLLRDGSSAVIVDCGPGTAGRVAEHISVNRLDGVVISHLHPDHYFDLVALNYLLKFGDPRPVALPKKVPLWVPPGGQAFFRQFGALIANKSTMLEDVFEICDYSPECQTQIGGLRFSFQPVQHYIRSHAMRIRSDTGALLTFSSDVAPCPQLVEAARDACAKRLLITHYRSNKKADAHHLATASAVFDGPVELAREGETYVVADR